MKRFLLICLMLLSAFEVMASQCSLKKIIYVKDALDPNAQWKIFIREYNIPITEKVFGIASGYFNGKDWRDYWFSPITCAPFGAQTTVTFESDVLPIPYPENPETIWKNDFLFPYGEVVELEEKLGDKIFLFKFNFTKTN